MATAPSHSNMLLWLLDKTKKSMKQPAEPGKSRLLELPPEMLKEIA
jgi:hypothetical protein